MSNTTGEEDTLSICGWECRSRVRKTCCIGDASGVGSTVYQKFVCKICDYVYSGTNRGCMTRYDTRSGDEEKSISGEGFCYHAIVVSFQIRERGISGSCLGLLK